jgi:arabinogalactan endo-1,4-beta-galactosidase
MLWNWVFVGTLALINLVAANVAEFFYKGHDLSSLKACEDSGTTYKDVSKANQTRPAEDILGAGGMNTVRLRYVICRCHSFSTHDIQKPMGKA